MDAIIRARAPRLWLNPTPNELMWSGHLYDYSGYAKANREIMFRLAKDVTIQTTHDGIAIEPRVVDAMTASSLDQFKRKRISNQAALVRFYVPIMEKGDKYKICYTMMETEEVHPDFISRLNNYYNEVWTPTAWNKRAFEQSGLQMPCYVMPLGVDEKTFKPGVPGDLPRCELISTKERNKLEVPEGFIFLYVFQPTFRKGLSVLLECFEAAFQNDPTTKLVIGATAHSFGVDYRRNTAETCLKSKVYLMKGHFGEAEMAGIYRSVQAYVSTSMGEGWNLPASEAAACGVPCILPAHSAHLEYADDSNCYLIKPDAYGPISGAGLTCVWYKDMPFGLMGDTAKAQLVNHLKSIRSDYKEAKAKASLLSERMRAYYTWDLSARRCLERLQEIWQNR